MLRGLLAALATFGVGCSLVAVSTTAQPPFQYKRPMQELLLPAFLDQDLSLNPQSFLSGWADPMALRGHPGAHAAWNVGELLGLRGWLSLAPLLALWLVAGAAWFAIGRRERSAHAG